MTEPIRRSPDAAGNAPGVVTARGGLRLVTSPGREPFADLPTAPVEPGLGMLASDLPVARRVSDTCPRCSEPHGRLTLLTSMVRYYACARCARAWQVVRDFDADGPQTVGRVPSTIRARECGPGRSGPRPHVSPLRIEVAKTMTDIEIPVTANVPTDASLHGGSSPAMIPGQRETSPLTRFAASRPAVDYPVDVTLDAATVADRQREGGGAPSERGPIRLSPWMALKARFRALGSREDTAAPAPSTAVKSA
jgi:hypothetical protein